MCGRLIRRADNEEATLLRSGGIARRYHLAPAQRNLVLRERGFCHAHCDPWALALVVAVGLASGQTARAVQPSANVAPVKVLEVGHGKVPGKPAVITAVALAAGGKVLASGGDDHLVRIWNTQTGELTQTLKAHADWVRSLSFNPDHTLLLSAGDDHLLVLWKLGENNPHRVLAERGAPIYSAVFAHKGDMIAAVGFEEEVTIYDVDKGNVGAQAERALSGPALRRLFARRLAGGGGRP